jgi:hypothetical protein
MGHQVLYSFCRKCGGMWGSRNSKQIFNDCKCANMKPRKQMKKEDFEILHIIMNDKTMNDSTKSYWGRRVVERIDYLKPLISECQQKKIDLSTLSEELHKEWIELNEVREFYKL